MLTAEMLSKANEQIKTVPIKGKDYAQVAERIRAFRSVCPGGQITTEIIELANGIVTMKATINDEEGRVIATGLAQEKESSSFINKTSYIENCETSAVGRALGFAGIGVDGSIATAEEVANAIMNQGDKPKQSKTTQKPAPKHDATPSQDVDMDLVPHGEGMTEDRLHRLTAEMERTGVLEATILGMCHTKSLKDISESQYIAVMNKFAHTEDKA